MLTYISQGGLMGDVPPFYYSQGLRNDGIALSKAYPGQVRLEHFDHTQDGQVLNAVVAAWNRGDKIMCTSHSLGANDFLNLVLPACAARGIIIDCGITFDPTWNVLAAKVGNEVRRVINFYNTDWLSLLGKRQVYAKPGFLGHIANIPLNVAHQNIDDSLSGTQFVLREGGYLVGAPVNVPTPVNPPQGEVRPTATNPVRPGRDLSQEFPSTGNIS